MDDFEEPRRAQGASFHTESWDEYEIQIEDLGAPDKGISLFLFSCGRTVHAAFARLRPTPVVFITIACLLALLLLPGSTLLSPAAPAPHSASSLSSQYIEVTGCTAILVSPTEITTWEKQVAPEAPGEVIIYDCGTPQSTGGKP